MEIKKYRAVKGNYWQNYIGEVGEWVCVSKFKYHLLKLFGYKVRIHNFKEGDEITITWLPDCKNAKGAKNPYIGMRGIIEDLKPNGEFCLNTGNSVLICSGKLNYIKHD